MIRLCSMPCGTRRSRRLGPSTMSGWLRLRRPGAQPLQRQVTAEMLACVSDPSRERARLVRVRRVLRPLGRVCWVVASAIAAVIALPVGLTRQHVLARHLAGTATGITALVLPSSFVYVLSIADIAMLILAGLGIAVAGALGPRHLGSSRTITALRSEYPVRRP